MSKEIYNAFEEENKTMEKMPENGITKISDEELDEVSGGIPLTKLVEGDVNDATGLIFQMVPGK